MPRRCMAHRAIDPGAIGAIFLVELISVDAVRRKLIALICICVCIRYTNSIAKACCIVMAYQFWAIHLSYPFSLQSWFNDVEWFSIFPVSISVRYIPEFDPPCIYKAFQIVFLVQLMHENGTNAFLQTINTIAQRQLNTHYDIRAFFFLCWFILLHIFVFPHVRLSNGYREYSELLEW